MVITTIDIIWSIILFFLGASLASFYNAQIYRIEKGWNLKKLVTAPSCCEKCKSKLDVVDLIPVIGVIIRKGKCKKCGFKVPLFYPISEFILGATFVYLYILGTGFSIFLLVNILFFLAIYDYQYKGFSKTLTHMFIAVSIVKYLFDSFSSGVFPISGILFASVIFIVVIVMNRFKFTFGIGDLLVLIMLSLWIKLTGLIALIFVAILISGVTAIILLLTKKVGRKDTIPFVPFIFFALLIVIPLQSHINRYFTYLLLLW